MGAPRPPGAGAGRLERLGPVHRRRAGCLRGRAVAGHGARCRRGAAVQIQSAGPRRGVADAAGPVCPGRRGAARHRQPADPAPCPAAPPGCAGPAGAAVRAVRGRLAPPLGRAVLHRRRAGPGAGALPAGKWLHRCGADAVGRIPLRRQLGVPGLRVLLPQRPDRRAPGDGRAGGGAAPRRDRGLDGLCAGPLCPGHRPDGRMGRRPDAGGRPQRLGQPAV